jgi:outer membrane protein insertion porin family
LNKRKYKSIACAFALATSFATINFSPAYAAEDETSTTETSAEDAGVTTTADATAPAADAPAATETAAPVADAAPAPSPAPEAATPADTKAPASKDAIAQANKIEAWRAVRPEEAVIKQAGQSYVGQTVVSVDIADSALSAQALSAVKLKAGDVLGAESVSQDRQAIYETGMFYDVYPSFVAVPEGVKITYHVMENPVLKSIEIVGNKALDTKTIKSMLTVSEGQILNSKTLNANISEIEARYRKDGFILSKISDINMSNEGVLRLTFNEGILEGYAVKGNEKTKSYVITREMRMKPGEAFNVKKARRSMQRVYNLGFFEDVNMKLNPGREPNSIILETDVVEKRTGNFAVGAGYSSSDGFLGMVAIGDKNFRGTGDSVNLSYEFSGDSTDNKGYVFTYTRPWLDKKETTGTIRVYNRTYQYDDYGTDGNLTEEYRKKYSGGEITLGRPASEYSTNYVTLRNRTDEYISHVKDEGTDRSTDNYASWREANFGLTRSITLQHITDTRDNIYNPTSGGRISLQTEVAGFGGDFSYQKYTIENNHYIKVGHAQVIALRGQYGRGNGSIPESAQYRLGGQDSLRGYRDDQFKGNNMFSGTIEYRFPIVSKVQGALFTDFGNAWNESTWSPGTIHHSIGVGLQLETPIGPIRFDVGHGEDGNRTDFSVGGTF